jgi:hypothetical protein
MTFKTNRAQYQKETSFAHGFGGMNECAEGESGGGLCALENFDILPDGSLCVRSGFRVLKTLQAKPRAIWQGDVDGQPSLYCLIGNKVYAVHGHTPSFSLIGEVGKSDGDGAIFWLGDRLYVLDGEELYSFDENDELSVVGGYVPLYGKGWDCELRGEINESINYLSDRIMINYKTTVENLSVSFGVKVASIDRVECGGEVVDASEYGFSLSEDGMSASCLELPYNKSLTLWLTLAKNVSQRTLLTHCTRVLSCVGGGGYRLGFYGGFFDGEMFFSHPTDEYSKVEAKKAYPDTGELYFPKNGRVNISNSRHKIKAIVPHFGRYILFTDKDARCLDWNGREGDGEVLTPDIIVLNSGIGSDISDSAPTCGNDPVTFFGGGLWRWHSASGVRDECSAILISDPIGSYLPDKDGQLIMISCPVKNEIWIASAEDEHGRVLIYNDKMRAWRVYSGIYPDYFFVYGGSVGFGRGETLYIFDEERGVDSDTTEETEIFASAVSHRLDFGTPAEKKRRLCFALDATVGGGKFTLSLESDPGERRTITLSGEGRRTYSDRITLCRFHSITFSLESDASSPTIIHGIAFEAK